MANESTPSDNPATENRFGIALRKSLEVIATVGGPPGLIAIFCQLMDVPSRTTAAFSLATICFVLLCLYRRFINERVPSSFVLGMLIALGMIFFLNYENILLKDTGLVKYYKRSSEIQGDLLEEMAHTEDEMWLFGTNFYKSTSSDKSFILSKLQAGVDIHYLIFDPFSPRLNQVAKDFDQSPRELKRECLYNLEALRDLRQKWQNGARLSSKPGELEVRFYDTTPRMRGYFLNPNNEKGRAFLVPYINKVNSPDLPAFQFKSGAEGVAKDYFAGVKRLWQESISLEDYLKLHKDEIDTFDGDTPSGDVTNQNEIAPAKSKSPSDSATK